MSRTVLPTSEMADPTLPGSHLSEGNLVSTLQDLVRFPSEQSSLQEKDPQIAKFIRECAAPMLERHGATCLYDEMGNLIIEAGPPSRASVLFVGYAMTHPAARMVDPFLATTIETPRGKAVRGRGVAEQKTALAALFGALAETLASQPLTGRLSVLLLTAGETGRHDAIACAVSKLECKPTFAVVCIGTNTEAAIGNKGRIDFDILIRGRASHSSAPWNGINAIAGAQRILASLEDLQTGLPEHPKFGKATLTPTAIDSEPKATHTVPDLVRVTYDRRLLPGEIPDEVYRGLCAAITLPEPWKVEFELGPVMFPNELASDGHFIGILRSAFADIGRPNPSAFHCDFALDAGYLSAMGIESVMLGPGDVAQFHSNDENVLVSDLVAMARVYKRIMELCLAADR